MTDEGLAITGRGVAAVRLAMATGVDVTTLTEVLDWLLDHPVERDVLLPSAADLPYKRMKSCDRFRRGQVLVFCECDPDECDPANLIDPRA
jgi:hypothetical protein